MGFDLWDVETNQYLGHYEDEADALILVRTLIHNYGPAYADALELGGITAEGEALESITGATLILRAEDVLLGRHDDQGQRGIVVGSRVALRGATSEEP